MFLAFTEEGIDDDPVRTEGEMTNDHNKRWLSEKKKRKKNQMRIISKILYPTLEGPGLLQECLDR